MVAEVESEAATGEVSCGRDPKKLLGSIASSRSLTGPVGALSACRASGVL